MKIKDYQTILSSHLTEKGTNLMQGSNQYAFKVNPKARKHDIKKAIESLYSVEVQDVTVLRVKGKVKKSKHRFKKRPDWKKAYVKLAEGQSIEIGVE